MSQWKRSATSGGYYCDDKEVWFIKIKRNSGLFVYVDSQAMFAVPWETCPEGVRIKSRHFVRISPNASVAESTDSLKILDDIREAMRERTSRRVITE